MAFARRLKAFDVDLHQRLPRGCEKAEEGAELVANEGPPYQYVTLWE